MYRLDLFLTRAPYHLKVRPLPTVHAYAIKRPRLKPITISPPADSESSSEPSAEPDFSRQPKVLNSPGEVGISEEDSVVQDSKEPLLESSGESDSLSTTQKPVISNSIMSFEDVPEIEAVQVIDLTKSLNANMRSTNIPSVEQLKSNSIDREAVGQNPDTRCGRYHNFFIGYKIICLPEGHIPNPGYF